MPAEVRRWFERCKTTTSSCVNRQTLCGTQYESRVGSDQGVGSARSPPGDPIPSDHFAVEIHDWDEMIANLDTLGVPYTPPTIRAYSGGHSTYIQGPDGNGIELVQHPLGLKDSKGKAVELLHDPNSLTWARPPGYGPAT